MKRRLIRWAWGLALVAGGCFTQAGELSLQGMPQARIQYEGAGYREAPNGWELKVKPWTPAAGIRWRTNLSPALGFQMQYWQNRSAFALETGNAASSSLNQTGQTELAFHALWVDVRRPLVGSNIEAVLGANGVYQSFHRKDVVFNQVPEPGEALETQTGLGAYLGFHGSGLGPRRGRRPALFWDGEILIGHLFWTRNNLTTDDGSIHQGGYTYAFRVEGGLAWPRWRLSLGYARQLYAILVPGGRRFTAGSASSAAASLPINKTDLFAPFIAVGWTY